LYITDSGFDGNNNFGQGLGDKCLVLALFGMVENRNSAKPAKIEECQSSYHNVRSFWEQVHGTLKSRVTVNLTTLLKTETVNN